MGTVTKLALSRIFGDDNLIRATDGAPLAHSLTQSAPRASVAADKNNAALNQGKTVFLANVNA